MIIFDLDGTLHRTEVLVIAAVNHAARELQLKTPAQELIKAGIGVPGSDFPRHLFPNAAESAQLEFHRRYRKWESKLIPELAELYHGIADLIAQLGKRRFLLAVCSNGSRQYVDSVLGATGIARHFAHITGHLEGRSKAQALAELLSLSGCRSAVFVGDRALDLESARENHLPLIGALWGYGAPGELDGMAYCAQDLEELLGHLLRWRVFSRVEELIAERHAQGPLVVGISGIDTAGKTRFAHGLKAHLGARGYHTALIHLDDFHNPRAERRRGADEVTAYYDYAFNLELLAGEVLQPLRENGRPDKRLRLLDLDTDTFAAERHWRIKPDAVVILEGSLLLRPPVAQYIDVALHLEISFDEMLRRAADRDRERFGEDVVRRYREKYIPVQQRYLREHRPQEQADLVIDNTKPEDPRVVER